MYKSGIKMPCPGQLSPQRISSKEVSAKFQTYPIKARRLLRSLRRLIIETGSALEPVGPLEETLKWGEPAYLTRESKSGSTVRLDWKLKNPDFVAVYFKCTADLVPVFRRKYSGKLSFEGNRSILLKIGSPVPVRELEVCIAMSLTYHLNKKLPAERRWKFVEELLRG